MGRRSEKTKKVGRKPGWVQHARSNPQGLRVSCFVCDEDIIGKGVPLLISHTSHSKTGLPAKIGELMGEGFMVVVSMEDTLCKRCSSLLNHLDKLEADVVLVKKAITDYLKVKYQLTDEDLAGQQVPQIEDTEQMSYPSPITDTTNDMNERDIEMNEDVCVIEEDEEVLPYQNEYDEQKSESDDEHGTAKRVNVEIILEDSSSQRRNKKSLHKCLRCNFETSDLNEFSQHDREECRSPLHTCSICGKIFESNKNIQNHIMQAHLSKWTCYFCHISFTEEEEYTTHVKSHLDSTLYSSHIKLEPIHSEGSDNSNHFEAPKNVLGNYECNICDFQSENKLLFEDHLRQHVVLKLFKCTMCGARFEDKQSLSKHELEHQEGAFTCNICSLAFMNAHDLVIHLETHNDKIVCDVKTVSLSEWDNEDFLDQSNLSIENNNGKKAEITTDKQNIVEDKSFQFHTCSSCSLTFVNDDLFKEHMKSHNILVKDLEKHENCIISSIVEPNDFVENVMEECLEDMLAKMNSQSEESYEAQGKEGLPQRYFLKCSICNEEFGDAESLETHKIKHVSSDSSNSQPSIPPGLNNGNEETLLLQQNSNHMNPNILNVLQNLETNDKKINETSTNYVKTEMSSSHDYKYDDDVSIENIYKMVCDKKLPSIETTMLDNENENILKPEDFQFASKQGGNCPRAENNNEMQEKKVTVRKSYICAICGFKTMSTIELKQHFAYHREQAGGASCKICKQFFPSYSRLRRHIKSHYETASGKKVACPTCTLELPDKNQLIRHIQEQHPKEKIVHKCEYCEQEFPSRKAYKVHIVTHPERLTYSCDECKLSFVKEKQLVDHKDLNHRDPHCKYCGKEILKLKTLRNHELRHQKEKDNNYECDICKRVFKTKTGLRHHVAVHTGEYKYCCDYCGRGFMSRMMMEEHRSMHTKEERYICDVCGRKFTFQSTYWIHRKWHDNPYPYKCSFCGRMFRHSSLLAVHKRKHTGERPYKCPHCPLSFPVGGTLKRHLILHTGVYPFNCSECNRGFTTRHKYATHLAKTHGDYDLLNSKPLQNDFKMVVREDNEPRADQEPTTMWHFADDSEQGELNFKLAVAAAAGNDGLESLDPTIPIVSEDLLSDSILPTRMVQIVLDETSQAVATVTLADHSGNLLPELWYQ